MQKSEKINMLRYAPGMDVGQLEDWPFDNPDSAYVVVSGDPRASGRLDAGGPGHSTRRGIWRCSTGVFECTEQGDEMMTVLKGKCRITWHDTGQFIDLGPGDTAFMRDGKRVTWDVTEEITKVFFAYKSSGY